MRFPALLQQKLPLPIAPRGGAVGSVVRLSASGLPPQVTLLVAFANLQNYQLVGRVTTDGDGHLETTGRVPSWAELDGVHYWFVSFSDEIPLALSDGFHVTSADGTARVRGTLGERKPDCTDLHPAGEQLYHLVGDLGSYVTGDAVRVSGSIADPSMCSGTGIAIQVNAIGDMF